MVTNPGTIFLPNFPCPASGGLSGPWAPWPDSASLQHPALPPELGLLAVALNTSHPLRLFFELCAFEVTTQWNQVFRTSIVPLSQRGLACSPGKRCKEIQMDSYFDWSPPCLSIRLAESQCFLWSRQKKLRLKSPANPKLPTTTASLLFHGKDERRNPISVLRGAKRTPCGL